MIYEDCGHIKFLPWGQLDGCSMTRPFLSAKGAACEINERHYRWEGGGEGLTERD